MKKCMSLPKKPVSKIKHKNEVILSKKLKRKSKTPASKIDAVSSQTPIELDVVVCNTVTDVKLDVVVKTRGRKRSPEKMYFTNDTEDSIELFNKTESLVERENIFINKIKYPIEKLVENVFNTFKFTYFETGPLDVQKETVSHLVANINKYEKHKGKAFSYFSIVAKHYLIFLNNSNYKRFSQSVEIGEDREEHTVQLQTEDKHHKDAELSEFMRLMICYWETNIGKIFTKQKDLNIANAVIELFRNSDRIDAFNKKALYLYIRDISNCKTQHITKVINKMKQCHVNITKSYRNTGTIKC